jgi:hypothetical protein
MSSPSIRAKAILAEKIWDTFRSLNYYRGMCRKTYNQLGVPSQNVWLSVAMTAHRELTGCQVKKLKKTPKGASTG